MSETRKRAATVNATRGQGGESHDTCLGTYGPLTLEGIYSKQIYMRAREGLELSKLHMEVEAEPGLEPRTPQSAFGFSLLYIPVFLLYGS